MTAQYEANNELFEKICYESGWEYLIHLLKKYEIPAESTLTDLKEIVPAYLKEIIKVEYEEESLLALAEEIIEACFGVLHPETNTGESDES